MEIALVPFFERDKEGEEGFGYANSETLEIVIPSQYQTATNFVGDYAVVQKESVGKHSIINKKNIEVMKNFDDAYLYQLDNGTILALIMNYHGWEVYDTGFFGRRYAQGPKTITFRLYDLNRGVLLKTDPDSGRGFDVIIIDNYIIYYDTFEYFDVYEIGLNGSLEKIDITINEFFSRIIQEKKLQYRENNIFSYVSNASCTYSYKNIPDKSNPYNYTLEHFELEFGYFDSLDINELIRNIPSDMEIITFGDNRETLKYDIDIINWDNRYMDSSHGPYPFKKRNYLYKVGLVFTESKNKNYTGLYDSSENSWVIPPVSGNGNFHIIDENWIAYDVLSNDDGCYWIYNIKTKERHEGMYMGGETFSPRKRGYYLYFRD
jgi:hypothetical protein